MNILRGDIPRLERCVNIITHDENGGSIPRAKPFKYTYQKEIVMYAYYKKLDYFSTECLYSPNAYRGHARDLIKGNKKKKFKKKDLERVDPLTIINIIHSGESFRFDKTTGAKKQELSKCKKCGYISSQELCRACVFLDGLNKGKAKLAIDYSKPNNQKVKNENVINKNDIDF
jgi:cytoplasmic tRNA 2-thiolation protein 1